MSAREVNYYIKTQDTRRAGRGNQNALPSLDESIRTGLKLFQPYIILKDSKLFIDHSARIDGFTKLECGEGLYIEKLVHVASFVHILGGGICILEEGSSLASGVKLITGSNIPGIDRGCSAIDPNAKIERSYIHIKKNAVLFCGAIVLPGITIGEGAVIGAGSVVTKDVPDGEIWVGSPARKVKSKQPNRCSCLVKGLITDDSLPYRKSVAPYAFKGYIADRDCSLCNGSGIVGKFTSDADTIVIGKPITSEDWVERFSEVYEIYDNENPLFI